MTKREFLDTVFALAPDEANAIMDAFDEYVESNEPHWIPVEQDTPTEDDDYWATFEAETGRFVDWASWYQGRWVTWIEGSPAPLSNVIAWCKSMEPYKGGDGMSVLIKGMEMPQNCDKCRFQSALKLYCDAMPYNFCGNTDDIERPDWCPLIEVPTPHGRLIDGDALINELASEHVGGLEAIKKYTNADTWTAGLHTAWRTIDDADTVIEAED